jgi:hypothetical protein
MQAGSEELNRFLNEFESTYRFVCEELGIDATVRWERHRGSLECVVREELRLYVNNLRSWENCVTSCVFQMIYGRYLY